MDPPDPIEAIKFRMEQQGLKRRDLEESHWHAPSNRRGLELIRRLHERLGVSAEAFDRAEKGRREESRSPSGIPSDEARNGGIRRQ